MHMDLASHPSLSCKTLAHAILFSDVIFGSAPLEVLSLIHQIHGNRPSKLTRNVDSEVSCMDISPATMSLYLAAICVVFNGLM